MGTATIYKIAFVFFVVRDKIPATTTDTHQCTNMPHPGPAGSPSPPPPSLIELENPSMDNTSLSTQEDSPSPSFHSIPPLAQMMDNEESEEEDPEDYVPDRLLLVCINV
jgi:hypothetical protein